MSDIVTRKDLDDLKKSLTDRTEVVDGLAKRIGDTLGEGEAESRRQWRECEGPSTGRQRGKEQVYTSSSSDDK